MQKGHYIKFTELHIDPLSQGEAHGSCGFLYWHRLMLLGFENMLRSYGDTYKCITIPYWDYITESAAYMDKQCFSLENCSSLIQDLGGSAPGRFQLTKDHTVRPRLVNLYGQGIRGYSCVNGSVLNDFCEHPQLRGKECARCVPRGPLATLPHPSAANYAAIYQQLFPVQGPKDLSHISSNLMDGVHNTMHSLLSGVMSTFRAPADPIFFSHHATIDLLQTIHYKCRIGTRKLSRRQKLSNAFVAVDCPTRTNSRWLKGNTRITMRLPRDSTKANETVQVHDPGHVLYPFFKKLPRKYADLIDTRDLDESTRYTYQLNGLLAHLYKHCEKATHPKALLMMMMEEEKEEKRVQAFPFQASEASSSSSSSGTENDTHLIAPILKKVHTKSAKNLLKWTVEIEKILASSSSLNTTELVEEQKQMLLCLYYEYCLDGTRDFSKAFRKNFFIPSKKKPKCVQILQEMKQQNKKQQVRHFKRLLFQTFDCTNPPNITVTHPTKASCEQVCYVDHLAQTHYAKFCGPLQNRTPASSPKDVLARISKTQKQNHRQFIRKACAPKLRLSEETESKTDHIGGSTKIEEEDECEELELCEKASKDAVKALRNTLKTKCSCSDHVDSSVHLDTEAVSIF